MFFYNLTFSFLDLLNEEKNINILFQKLSQDMRIGIISLLLVESKSIIASSSSNTNLNYVYKRIPDKFTFMNPLKLRKKEKIITPLVFDNVLFFPTKENERLKFILIFGNFDSTCIINLKEQVFIKRFETLLSLYLCNKMEDIPLIANLSHEIRTPLNGVIGYSHLLSACNNLDIVQRNYISALGQCSSQLLQIINDILDFSKLSSGKMTLNNDCCNIHEIFDAVNDILSNKIKEKRHECIFIIENNCPENIIIDKYRFIQIIINLLSNAIKYTNKGGKIKVTASSSDGLLKISVRDNGIGISEDDQVKLFSMFTRLNDKYREGTGIGLSISKKLIELMGGTITVISEIGKGSTFSFTVKYLPFDKIKEDRETNKSVEKLKGKKVLVVDDNVSNRVILCEMLFEWNMKPVACSSAMEAISYITGDRYVFSFALIDIGMPSISGIELAKQIKKIKPYLPLIALSSVDEDISTIKYFDCKLLKPVDKLHLFENIQKVTRKDENVRLTKKGTILNNTINKKINDGNVKILVAEDNAFNSDILINMLMSLNFKNIDLTCNGLETKKKLEQKEYDILLLDLKMPKIDGYEVIEYMKRKNLLNKIIVVVITACVSEEEKEKCKSLGVHYFISKPFDIMQLKKIMSMTL